MWYYPCDNMLYRSSNLTSSDVPFRNVTSLADELLLAMTQCSRLGGICSPSPDVMSETPSSASSAMSSRSDIFSVEETSYKNESVSLVRNCHIAKMSSINTSAHPEGTVTRTVQEDACKDEISMPPSAHCSKRLSVTSVCWMSEYTENNDNNTASPMVADNEMAKEFQAKNELQYSKTIPEDVIIRVFGFDPSKSPFTVSGYPVLSNMFSNLDHLHLPQVDRKKLRFMRRDDGLFECVGQGSFGCVFVAEMTGREGRVVVKDYIYDNVTLEVIEHEAKVLTYLKDTHYVPEFVGVLKSTASSVGFSLVQDYFADGLTVHKLLISKENLCRITWMRICCELVVGLHCIHSKHVLLNDIKSDNVLVDLSSVMPNVKYIDLGLATYRQGLKFEKSNPHVDQYTYLAPEVCMGAYSSTLSDIYSLGYLLKQIGRKSGISELTAVSEACLELLPVERMSLVDLNIKLVDISRTVGHEEPDLAVDLGSCI